MKKNNAIVAGGSGGSKGKRDKGDDGSEGVALLGKWQFSVESETDTNVFAAPSSEDREHWLTALLAASSYCHAVSEARLQQAKEAHKEQVEKLRRLEKPSTEVRDVVTHLTCCESILIIIAEKVAHLKINCVSLLLLLCVLLDSLIKRPPPS